MVERSENFVDFVEVSVAFGGVLVEILDFFFDFFEVGFFDGFLFGWG